VGGEGAAHGTADGTSGAGVTLPPARAGAWRGSSVGGVRFSLPWLRGRSAAGRHFSSTLRAAPLPGSAAIHWFDWTHFLSALAPLLPFP
jgi:hypothetical protein